MFSSAKLGYMIFSIGNKLEDVASDFFGFPSCDNLDRPFICSRDATLCEAMHQAIPCIYLEVAFERVMSRVRTLDFLEVGATEIPRWEIDKVLPQAEIIQGSTFVFTQFPILCTISLSISILRSIFSSCSENCASSIITYI